MVVDAAFKITRPIEQGQKIHQNPDKLKNLVDLTKHPTF